MATATRLRQLLIPSRIAGTAEAAAAPATRLTTILLLAHALHQTACDLADRRGHPPPPASLAVPLATLWGRTLKFDAADPAWADRDRFVLSCAVGTPLLYALLHVTGHPGMDRAALDQPPTPEGQAPGNARAGSYPAIEATAAPGGQAIAAAIGMAMAERKLAARFGKSLVDHRVWAVADAAELGFGVVQEAAAMAGQQRLDRLVLMVDAGADDAEDARPVFTALGWAVKSVAGQSAEEVEAALSFALRSRKPTLIWCQGRAEPLSARGRDQANPLEAWRRIGSRGSVARRAWLKRIARHPQRAEHDRVLAERLPDHLHETLAALRCQLKIGLPHATEQAVPDQSPASQCREVLDRLASGMPELCGGGGEARQPQDRGRPHGMLACLAGMALHGGLLPVGRSRLHHLPEQLPALRMAALQARRMIHMVLDPGLCGPGGAWHPAEALAWLRAIPGLAVFRPGCAAEAVECMELALRLATGPSVLMLASNALPMLRRDLSTNRCAAGGYVLAEAAGQRDATLLSTGPGLHAAMQASRLLALRGIAAAVVSLPCWELFAQQDAALRDAVLGTAPRFGIEAAGRGGWDRWLNVGGGFIGCEEPVVDGPAEMTRAHHGLLPADIAASIARSL